MYQQDTVLRLVSQIYDAALNPDAWPVFLEDFAALIGGHSVSLGLCDSAAPALTVSTSVRWDPTALHEYQLHFGIQDPWAIAGFRTGRLVQGVVGLGEEVVTPSALQRTEFYNDYGRRNHLVGGIAGIIFRDGRVVSLIGASRLPGRTFGPNEVALVTVLLPHLQRALQMHRRLTRLEAETQATADVFDTLPNAMVLVNAQGNVVLINGAASMILAMRDGLTLDRSRLCASVPRENVKMRQCIAECVATTGGTGLGSGGALTISRASGKRALRVLVTPLRMANRFAPSGVAAAAIFISDPERAAETDAELLKRFHNLTATETQLALLLAGGLPLRDAAAILRVTMHTVRGYLKNIFSKTDTRSQSQLVRLVLTTPSVRRPR
jgi:DNA-binding CsgD family transcriptional regulator